MCSWRSNADDDLSRGQCQGGEANPLKLKGYGNGEDNPLPFVDHVHELLAEKIQVVVAQLVGASGQRGL